MSQRNKSVTVALAGLAVILLGLAVYGYRYMSASHGPNAGEVSSAGTALVGGPFALTDGDGKLRLDTEFRGKLMLVYFGYTFCPDVCPTSLGQISVALDALGPLADKVQTVFITVDPQRDTPQVIGEYAHNFSPRILGLTGSPEQIASVAKAYRAYYKRVESKGASGEYTMDHSAIIYVMGADGAYRTHFNHGTEGDAMAAKLKALIAELPSS